MIQYSECNIGLLHYLRTSETGSPLSSRDRINTIKHYLSKDPKPQVMIGIFKLQS